MTPNITGQNIEITEPIQNLINTQFLKLEHHFKNIVNAKFILKLERNTHILEGLIHLPNNDICCKSENLDMYAAIDDVINKLDRQIIRAKEKMNDRHQSERSDFKHNNLT